MKKLILTICLLVALISGCVTNDDKIFDEQIEHHEKCIKEVNQSLAISGVLDSDIPFGWYVVETEKKIELCVPGVTNE